jgi:hypothetical protein
VGGKVPVRTCRWVTETVNHKVPVRICKIVCEQHVRKVPVRTCRTVCETKTCKVPYCVSKKVAYKVCHKVARCVAKQVPVTCTRMVAKCTPRKVAYEVCRLVPVTVCRPTLPCGTGCATGNCNVAPGTAAPPETPLQPTLKLERRSIIHRAAFFRFAGEPFTENTSSKRKRVSE